MKKRIILLLLAMTLALSLPACIGKEKDPNADNSGEETTTDDSSKTPEPTPDDSTVSKHEYNSCDYWLYTPDTPENGMPLIVYLHDTSDGANGIDGMIAKEGLTKTLYQKDQRVNAYVLMPCLSDMGRNWHDARVKLQTLVSYVVNNKNIDATKVYLTGFGEGAIGVYKIAMADPGAYAAYAPIGGMVEGNANAERLKDTKLIVYVTVDPEETGVESIMEFTFALGQINPATEVFVLENYNSASYARIYADMELQILQKLIGQ